MSLKARTNIDFMSYRWLGLLLSLVLVTASSVSLAIRGLNFSVDFTGGTLVELAYEQPADLNAIRTTLADSQFGGAVVQEFGSPREVMIRLAPTTDKDAATVSSQILALLPGAEMRRIEFVGPQVGEELAEDGILALLYALGGILVYVMLRFTFKFALGGIAALAHDVIIVLGVFSITQMEFDLTVLAAILATIGYSLNDTIVVFDRIRENFRSVRNAATISVVNASLNQTLARTIITGVTTFIVLVVLYFFGGQMIHGFAAALIIGLVIGTYSSIYVASATALLLGATRQDFLPAQKEGAQLDDRP